MGFLSWLFGIKPTERLDTPEQRPFPNQHMDEGDYHSGPNGYSPNTAYPETQYGSGFDEEADWNDDEH